MDVDGIHGNAFGISYSNPVPNGTSSKTEKKKSDLLHNLPSDSKEKESPSSKKRK